MRSCSAFAPDHGIPASPPWRSARGRLGGRSGFPGVGAARIHPAERGSRVHLEPDRGGGDALYDLPDRPIMGQSDVWVQLADYEIICSGDHTILPRPGAKTMPGQSSYLRHLPQVLWSNESGSEPFLGEVLCVFEKILTGIADGVPIRSGEVEYPPLKEVIDQLPKLFNPWSTRPEFLPWVASWVALELEPVDPYQQRKLITEIVSIYRLRGLEAGLHAYLDVYVQTPARPRIAIDDGSAAARDLQG